MNKSRCDKGKKRRREVLPHQKEEILDWFATLVVTSVPEKKIKNIMFNKYLVKLTFSKINSCVMSFPQHMT